MKAKRLIACSLALAAVASGPAWSHHSFAMFDFIKDLVLRGAVKEFRWANPHIHLLLDAPGAKGQVQVWDIEGQTPNSLRPQGWTRTSLQPGEVVSLTIHPLKNGGLGGSLVRANRADGSAIGRVPAPVAVQGAGAPPAPSR